jgi:hypothetical protein
MKKEDYIKKINEYKKAISKTNSIYLKKDYQKAIKKLEKKVRGL